MKYCKACNQNVQPTKKFSIVWFIINCLWLVGGIVYILYYLFGKSKVCPMCGGNDLEAKRDIKNFTIGEPGLDEKEQKQNKFNDWANDWCKRGDDANKGIGDSWTARMARDNIESARKRAEKKRLKQDKKLA